MIGYIISALVGAVCIILGISNMRGNISSLHSYHRQRVSEENVLPFGRLVGLGTIIVGAGIIIFSILSGIADVTNNEFFYFNRRCSDVYWNICGYWRINLRYEKI